MPNQFFSSLFHGKKKETRKPEPVERKKPRYEMENGFYYEYDQVLNGLGGYATVDVYLMKEDDPDFCRCIVDCAGYIQNFPGFRDEEWRGKMEFPFDDRVRFVFQIGPYRDGKASVRWLLQPDGRYFEDEDGFGAEYCEEIEMYSYLDEDGKFTEPFFCK